MRPAFDKRVVSNTMSESSAAIQTTVDAPSAPVAAHPPAATDNLGHELSVAKSDASEFNAIGQDVTDQHRPDHAGRIAIIAAVVLLLAAFTLSAWRHHSNDGYPPLPQPSGPVKQEPSLLAQIETLEGKVKENPEDTDSWRLLGWSHFQEGNTTQAATALRKAAALDPEDPETFSLLGEVLFATRKEGQRMPRSARRAFERALQLDPDDTRARFYRGVAMELDGRHRAAISAWFALMSDTAADAPYADDIRAVIVETARKHNIDIEKRMAAARFAPPQSGLKGVGPSRPAVAARTPTEQEMYAASLLPKGQQEATVRAMIEGVEARLRANPMDKQAWIMLMRSRMQLGERAKATRAYKRGMIALPLGSNASRELTEAAVKLGVPGIEIEPADAQPKPAGVKPTAK